MTTATKSAKVEAKRVERAANLIAQAMDILATTGHDSWTGAAWADSMLASRHLGMAREDIIRLLNELRLHS